MTTPIPKKRGDVYVGVLPSESNPPLMLEFLFGLQCMAECVLDKVVYAVADGESGDKYFAQTREHRCAMARAAATTFNPLIEVADVGDGHAIANEDLAFRLFALNRELQFTLFFLCPALARPLSETLERVAGNIGMRLHEFDPAKHRVVVVDGSLGEDEGMPYTVEGRARKYADNGLLGVHRFAREKLSLPGNRSAAEMVLGFLQGKDQLGGAILAPGTLEYLSEHEDFRARLTTYLSVTVRTSER